MQRTVGHYISASHASERFEAYIPSPLPPEPPLEWSTELNMQRDKANRALGRLDGITSVLPGKSLFLYQYVRKEALLSSQIEGTQSSLSDLLLYELDEAPGVPLDDVQEVSNYVAALEHGLTRMREGFPLSLRLLSEIHTILLRGARGKTKTPGEFRRSQVWLGGATPAAARFVPPPHSELMPCLDAFEKFLHGQPEPMPVLVKAALAHVQFETIHPYLDGNGRLGRLLITLLLCAEEVLTEPMLYLSLHFKQNRSEYYEQLQNVRLTGDWESWLDFFFRGVSETAQSAVSTAQRTLDLFESDRQKLQTLGKSAGSCIRLLQLFQSKPILSAPTAVRELALSRNAVANALKIMAEQGLVRELTGQERYRLYAYDPYLAILAEGTEPL